MEWVNITAKTLPEAIDLALENLGVDESEAEIEVLEEPRQGLFGRTRGNARVRARVKPKASRPRVERGRNRKRRPEDGEETGGRAKSGTSGGGRSRSGGGRKQAADESESVGTDHVAAVATADPDVVPRSQGGEGRDGRDSDGDRGRNRGNRSRSRSGGGGSNGRGTAETEQRETAEEASVEDVSNQLEEFLSGLTEAFGFDSPVSVVADDDEGIVGSVDGRHGLMVGPKGRTLEAIQELARVAVQRSAPSSVRIKVDVGGYREIRRQALQSLALEVAASVRLDGRERLLEPMNSADRKIVHDALSGEAGIETRSAGNEPNRRVVVLAAAGGTGAATSGAVAEQGDDGAVDGDDVVADDAIASLNGAHDEPRAEAEAVEEAEGLAAEADVADDEDTPRA